MLDDFTRAARRRYLGSSDASAVCGRDPWGRGPADVWLEKTGRLVDTRTPTAPMVVGTYLEPAILTWCEDTIGIPFTRDVFRTHPNEVLCANFDALALGLEEPAIVEAKTAGLLGRPGYLEAFGAADSDQLPEHVLLQVHHQFAVAAAQDDLPPIRLALVPVLLVGVGFLLYRVPRNDELVDALVDTEERFWIDHVRADIPPPDEVPSLDTLKRLIREPAKTVPVDEALVATWQEAKRLAKEARGFEDDCLGRVLAALGDAEAGTCALGTVTYREQTRAAYTAPAATFRVARFARFSPVRPAKKGQA